MPVGIQPAHTHRQGKTANTATPLKGGRSFHYSLRSSASLTRARDQPACGGAFTSEHKPQRQPAMDRGARLHKIKPGITIAEG